MKDTHGLNDKLPLLVTGGTGFIGRAMVEHLRRSGREVVCLARHSSCEGDLVADVTDPSSLERVLRGKHFDGVLHLAGAGTDPTHDEGQSVLRVNTEGTAHLLSALEALPPCPVVVTGSWTEYGQSETGLMREEDACWPTSTYGISKLAETLLVRAWSLRTGRAAMVARLFSVYGPGEASHRLGTSVLRALVEGRAPELNQPDMERDFVHLEDVVEALTRLLSVQEPGAIVNVGTGQAVTLRTFVEQLMRAYGSSQQPIWSGAQARPWDVPRACADTTRLEQLLGWKPRLRIEERMSDYVASYVHP